MDTCTTEDEVFDHAVKHWAEAKPGESLLGLGGIKPHYAVMDDIFILKFVDISQSPHRGALVPIGEDHAAIDPQRVSSRLATHFVDSNIRTAVLAPPGVAVPSKIPFFSPGEPAPDQL
jgi:hypothetical protein